MSKTKTLNYALLCTAAVGALMLARPAMAQSDTQIQSIEQQIKKLQGQLGQVKSDLAARDHALKAAQQQAKDAQTQAAAAQAQAARVQAAQAAAPVAAATAAPAEPYMPALKQGQFRVGQLTVTLGGFAALEGIDRSRNMASSVDTSFNSIPFANSPNGHVPEFRETAQQSRFSLLTEGNLDDHQKLTGYMETDFLSAGSSSNSNQSNSYTLRMRQFWGEYDNTNWGLHVTAGQTWSLATMYRTGLIPRQENVPLTIDAQYVVGFNWERQAALRIAKDWDDHKFWAGLSLEEPAALFGGTTSGTSVVTGQTFTNVLTAGGSNVNPSTTYSNTSVPDIIAKLAADPGWGHYEVYGLLRFLDSNEQLMAGTTTTGFHQQVSTGEGIGAGMILPLIPTKLEFQLSGLFGKGVGRYGSSQLPDATFSNTGKMEPLTEYSVMGGFVAHPTPVVDLYAYGGAEGADQKSYGANGAGYGNVTTNLSDCYVLGDTCGAMTSSIIEGTVGAWWRVIKSAYGTAQLGAQYEYIDRNAYAGNYGGHTVSPNTNENIFLFSVRYLPFQ